MNGDYSSQEAAVIPLLQFPFEAARAESALRGVGLGLGAPDYIEAEVRLANGDLVGAARKAKRAREADPASPLARAIELFLVGGDTTVEGLRLLVEQWPTLRSPHTYLGASLAARDQELEEAVAHERASLSIFPHDIQAWFYLGEALRRLGDRSGAASAYLEVGRLAKSPVWARATAQGLLGVRHFRDAFSVALEAASRFRMAKAVVLVSTLPFTVYDRVTSLALYILIAFFAITVANHEPNLVLLVIASVWGVWRLLGIWAGDQWSRRRSISALRRWSQHDYRSEAATNEISQAPVPA